MSRRPLTDAELAAMSPEKRGAVMRKRKMRERKAQGEVLPRVPRVELAPVVTLRGVPVEPAPLSMLSPIPADPEAPADIDTLAAEIFEQVRAQIVAAGRWNEAAQSGLLWTYAKMSAVVRNASAAQLAEMPAAITAAQARAAAALKLIELPADKARRADRFGSWG